jgi:hypothetical protein
MKQTRKARSGNKPAKGRPWHRSPKEGGSHPVRDNLLRHLASAKEYLESLREFETAGFSCGYSILRAKEEIEKLTRLTS